MSTPILCANPDTHTPHFWRWQGDHGTHNLNHCPGIDPDYSLPGDRDRPTWDVPDLTPTTLHLTDAAALVVRAFNDGEPTSAYYGMVAVWQELTGMTEPEALTYAFQIATVVPATEGVVIPL